MEKLKSCHFSLNFDEATSNSQACVLSILVSYYNKKTSFIVVEHLSSISDSCCVKSARIRSYSGPHFPTFALNMERYEVCIQPKCGKMRTRITPNADTFHPLIPTVY